MRTQIRSSKLWNRHTRMLRSARAWRAWQPSACASSVGGQQGTSGGEIRQQLSWRWPSGRQPSGSWGRGGLGRAGACVRPTCERGREEHDSRQQVEFECTSGGRARSSRARNSTRVPAKNGQNSESEAGAGSGNAAGARTLSGLEREDWPRITCVCAVRAMRRWICLV